MYVADCPSKYNLPSGAAIHGIPPVLDPIPTVLEVLVALGIDAEVVVDNVSLTEAVVLASK
jgi:hypothetical protein